MGNRSKKGPFFLRRAGVAMRFRRIATHSAHSRSTLYGWVRTPFFDAVFLIPVFRCRVLIDTDDHSPRQARDKHSKYSKKRDPVFLSCSGCTGRWGTSGPRLRTRCRGGRIRTSRIAFTSSPTASPWYENASSFAILC
jgi:hypothetical protein